MIMLKIVDTLYVGENVSNKVIVNVSEDLLSSQLFVEFDAPSGDKFCSPILCINPHTKEAIYSIPASILNCIGPGKAQGVAIKGDYTEKSEPVSFKVKYSVNAIETLPKDSPDLVRCLINAVNEFRANMEEVKNLALLLDTNISNAVGSGVLV